LRTHWATRQGGFWDAQRWFAGDVNGDGRVDLADMFDDHGAASTDVHASIGDATVLQHVAGQPSSYSDDQRWLAGDVNGDHQVDLVSLARNGNDYVSVVVHRTLRACE
jgi:hypothetical protein